MFLGVDLRADIKRRHVLKKDQATCSNSLIILGSIVNIIGGRG